MIKVWDNYRVPGRIRALYYLVALNVFAHIVSVMTYQSVYLQSMGVESFSELGGFVPAEWFSGELVNDHRPPLLVSVIWSLFLHGSWAHLFWNLAFLLVFGRNLEAQLKTTRFLALYLGSGVAGCLAHVIGFSHSPIPVIGASGAISGLLGAYWVFFAEHHLRIRLGMRFGIRSTGIREFEFPVWIFILLWLIPNVINAFLPLPGASSQTAYLAHIGGFIWGFIVARKPVSAKRQGFRVVKGGRGGGPYIND